MPVSISQELFTDFKKNLNNIFVSKFTALEYSEEFILLSYNEYDFHSSTAFKLNEVCEQFGLTYRVIPDPTVIKVKITLATNNNDNTEGDEE